MKISLTLTFIILSILSFAQHDHGHSHGEAVNTSKSNYNSVSAQTHKFEYVIHYITITPGTETILTLFISDYETNKPVENAKFIVENVATGEKFETHPLDKGCYEIHATFNSKSKNDIKIKLLYPTIDEALIKGIDAKKEEAIEEKETDSGVPVWLTILLMGVGFCIGTIVALRIKKINKS